MAYKLKFSPLQTKFIVTCCLFQTLDYASLRQVWTYSGGASSKVPSSLLKKLEEHQIMYVERLQKKNTYYFNPKIAHKVFTRIGSPIQGLSENQVKAPSTKAKEFEERFKTHDQLLYSLCLGTLGYFQDYSIEFPKDRSLRSDKVIPDAIYRFEGVEGESITNGYSLYLEFDNLTEGSVDFSSKLPRYIHQYERSPEATTLIYVFKGEPLIRISHLLSALALTRTVNKTSVLSWLQQHPEFKVYFLTESLWLNFGEEVSYLPLHHSEQLARFNVLTYLKGDNKDPQMIRKCYNQELVNCLGIQEELNLFNSSEEEEIEIPQTPTKKLFI